MAFGGSKIAPFCAILPSKRGKYGPNLQAVLTHITRQNKPACQVSIGTFEDWNEMLLDLLWVKHDLLWG